MINQTYISTSQISFKYFLLKNKRNRVILKLTLVAIIIQFSIFKYLYPYASFIHGDSFSYLDAANLNLQINTYLIGYSKFLRLISVFTKSDFILTALQYLLIQCSSLYLLFTIFFFYKPGNIIQIALLIFTVFNPLFLHLGNLISSDGLFLAISLTWVSLLIWIIHKPSSIFLFIHAVILVIAFSIRYNAMIYPLVGILVFSMCKLSLRKKFIGIGLGLLFCGMFVGFTMYKYQKLTGHWQYSPFSGWQFVNNAMYAYRYVDSAERKPVPQKFQRLDNMIRQYFDSTRDWFKHPQELLRASTIYMWTKDLTLYKYRDKLFKNDTTASEFKKWASMGPFYKEYGIYIIKQYPWYFIKEFVWPNANKYYAPPIEFLEMYNSGKKDVTEQAKVWFSYKSRNINTRMKNGKVWVLNFYPILSGIINAVMLCCTVCYFLLKGWRYNQSFRYLIGIGGSIWFLNAAFTILASSAALRFQSFPVILTTILVFMLIDWLVKMISIMKSNHIITKMEVEKKDGELENMVLH